MRKILVTGGAGYIGSHTTLSLLQANFDVVVLDNLSNSSVESLFRVEKISGRAATFIQGDIRDSALLGRFFSENTIDAVLHFAGLKAVGESVSQPLRYYDNNVHGSQVLLQAMAYAGVNSFVFSSSATVYGEPAQMPISESCPVGTPTNPYGRSKLIVEDILRDLAVSDPRWLMSQCRYFIIANSTFSWWGAWLGAHAGKQVIAPGFEIRQGKMSWGFDGLLPEEWIKL